MHRSSRKLHTGPARAASIYVVLVANKCMHVAALYWVVHVLAVARLPTSVMACWVLGMATAIALVLKRPWQQKYALPKRTYVRLVGNGLAIAVCVTAVLHAARTAGAFRAAVVGGLDVIAIGTMSAAAKSGLWSRKGRGLVLVLAGICLVAWAPATEPVSNPAVALAANSTHAPQEARAPSSGTDAPGTGDVLWATALLGIAAVAASGRRTATRRLAVDLGGRKRCHALSLAVATCTTLPVALYHAATWTGPTNGYSTYSIGVTLAAATMGLFTVVLGEYMHGVVAAKLRQPLAANVSLAATTLSCGFLSLASGTVGDFSAAAVLGVAILGVGTSMLVVTARDRSTRAGFSGAGGLNIDDGMGLPLYDAGDPDETDPNRSRVALTFRIRRIVRHILDDKDSRKIFFFLSVNLMFMFVELVVGWWTNSLGLISDAGHMFFDNASLFIGLYASYMAKWRKDDVFTYGYGRYEVLAGFVNAIFLVFVGFSVVLEGLERLFTPPEIHGDHLLTVAVLGLLVNLIGIFFFAEAHGGHGHSHGGHGHSHGNDNMEGIFLHVLADTLGSVGVIVSSLLIQYKGWYWSDAGASLFISALILLSVVPLVRNTASVLLSGTPPGYEEDLRNCFVQIATLDGVTRVWKPHAWKLRSDYFVVTVHIQVSEDADEQGIKDQAIMLLKRCGCTDVTLQVEKQQFLQRMSAGSDLLHATEPLTFHRSMSLSLPQVDHVAHHAGGHGHAHGSRGHAHGSHGHAHGGHGHAHDSHGHDHGSHGHAHGAHGHPQGSDAGHVEATDEDNHAALPHAARDIAASAGTAATLGARRVGAKPVGPASPGRPPARLSMAPAHHGHSAPAAVDGSLRSATDRDDTHASQQ